MLPTFEPSGFFEQALGSVLAQDPGPSAMQVAVIDDASTGSDVGARVGRLAPPGRVEFRRQPRNLGLAGNWNACVELARGRWVHILHQDDLALPGFYERLAEADAAGPEVGAAFCRFAFIDAEGRPAGLSEPERAGPGVLDDGWLDRIARGNRVQCPSVVVRREAYEALGPFRDDLVFALDWEMWVRLSARYRVWYEPTALACYRTHPGNESARLLARGAPLADLARAVAVVRSHLPARLRRHAGSTALAAYRYRTLCEADRRLRDGDARGALRLVREVRRHGGRRQAARWYVSRWLRAWAPRLAGGAAPAPRDDAT
jgi:glycosyltransferase involved in cell wall biosynthesis